MGKVWKCRYENCGKEITKGGAPARDMHELMTHGAVKGKDEKPEEKPPEKKEEKKEPEAPAPEAPEENPGKDTEYKCGKCGGDFEGEIEKCPGCGAKFDWEAFKNAGE
jgi:hypothetical protein